MAEFFKWAGIFLAIAIGSGVCWHAVITTQSRAIAGAALTTALVYRGMDYWFNGHVGFSVIPLFIVNFIFGFAIALLVAVPFTLWRRED